LTFASFAALLQQNPQWTTSSFCSWPNWDLP